MAIFNDDFTGTNGDQLVARTGWTKFGAGSDSCLTIQSNNLQSNESTDCPTVGQNKGGVDHWAWVLLGIDLSANTDAQNRFSLCVRTVDRNERVNASYDPGYGGRWGIYRSGSGRLDSVTGFAATAGTKVYLEADGINANLYIDDVLALTVDISNATFDDNTNVAILSNTDGVTTHTVATEWHSGLMSDLGGSATVTPNDVNIATEVQVPSLANASSPISPQDVNIATEIELGGLSNPAAPGGTLSPLDVNIVTQIEAGGLSNASGVALVANDVNIATEIEAGVLSNASATPTLEPLDVNIGVEASGAALTLPTAGNGGGRNRRRRRLK